MAECLPAEIQIGGKVRRSVAEALCGVIAESHASLDWGEAEFQPALTDELLSSRDDDGLLSLYDDQAPWGEFASLEAFLQEHGIPYHRYTEGRYEYDPEMKAFHPDSGLVTLVTDHDRNLIVQASELVPIAEALAKLLQAMEQRKAPVPLVQYEIQKIHDTLRRELLPNVSALESLEIIDD